MLPSNHEEVWRSFGAVKAVRSDLGATLEPRHGEEVGEAVHDV